MGGSGQRGVRCSLANSHHAESHRVVNPAAPVNSVANPCGGIEPLSNQVFTRGNRSTSVKSRRGLERSSYEH
jgi:hypothetical protein